ncbi:MAG: ZIP family metal transporter [Longimicrobiales bacterium]
MARLPRRAGDVVAVLESFAVGALLGDAFIHLIPEMFAGGGATLGPSLLILAGMMLFFLCCSTRSRQEMGDFGVLVHSGLGVRKATLVNLASACMAIVGAILALLLGGVAGSKVVQVVLPITAGGFDYIAAADLIPELQHERSGRGLLTQVTCISLGVAVMVLLTRVGG